MTHNPCPWCRKSGGSIVTPEEVRTGSLLGYTTTVEVYSCGACKAYIGIAPPAPTPKRGEQPDYDYTARTWNRLTEPKPAVPAASSAAMLNERCNTLSDRLQGQTAGLNDAFKEIHEQAKRVDEVDRRVTALENLRPAVSLREDLRQQIAFINTTTGIGKLTVDQLVDYLMPVIRGIR